MNRQCLYLSLLSLSIAACSNVSNKQANGGFEYAKNDEAQSITIPNNLDKPKQKDEFFIPMVTTEGPVGEAMDIRGPSLVLPIAAASRVEGNEGEAKVWFDQVLDDRDLLEFIKGIITEKSKVDGIALTTVEGNNPAFESDWYKSEKESGFWFLKEVSESVGTRYKYSLDTKPHGRSVAIKVDLIDYKRTDESGTTTEINPIDKHRAEMAMLNQFIGEVDYEYRKLKRDNILMRASQNIVTIGENPKNKPAFIVDMELDALWSNMPLFFKDYGFTTTDLNESKNIYYVDFIKPGTGFWASLWGSDSPQIDLKDGKYRFDLDEVEEKTSVTLLDSTGEALDSATLERILPVIEKGLSFKTLL